MAKKGGGSKSKASGGKKVGGNKSRKTGMFKALKKQGKNVLQIDKNDLHTKRKTKLAKYPTPVSNEFRNFDERMAAKGLRRSSTASKTAAVASTTFVMAAPTFQFNANTVQPTVAPTPREVEGFCGFLSALDAPKDAPTVNLSQVVRQTKPIQPGYYNSNVFAVLDDGDEKQQETQVAPQTQAAFMHPATFTFTAPKSVSTLSAPPSHEQRMQTTAVDIDPDL